MKRKLVILIALLLIALLSLISIGCNKVPPIVGKWQDSQSYQTAYTTEFLKGNDKGGNFVIVSDVIITGKYELIGSDVLKLVPDANARPTTSLQYTISGDVMKVTTGSVNMTWKRITK